MPSRKVVHAWSPVYCKTRCGVETGTDEPITGEKVTCKRCLAIEEGRASVQPRRGKFRKAS